ncbi:MAG: ABC transporter substrate-binding protein [Clostridiales bacterium]|nr:ABC transporter substrate-binding protein [Clostridiales bacterium]
MKKVFALLLALAMSFSLVACGGTSGESSGEASSAASSEASASADAEGESGSGSVTNEEEVSTAVSEAEAEASSTLPEGLTLEEGAEYKVGIVNWVDDASLNQIVENLEEELDAIGAAYGVTFNYGDYYSNAQADQTVLAQIGADLLADEVDIIVAVATPTAAVMQSVTEDTDIPVVFAAVSDPVGAQLVDSMDAPGGNITGTSDALDTEAILNLALTADPDMATLGLLYNTSEDSSTQPIADAKAWCEANGIAYEEKTGSTTDDVLLAAQSLISDGVDAVFTPTDNTVMTAELTIYELFQEAQIPHYCGADSFALNGAFLGYGVDYAVLGATTGDMVAEILAGADPAATPVRTFENGIASINTETCEAIGFDLAEIEELFAPLCTQIVELTTAESFE